MRLLSLCLLALTASPLFAQSAQFTAEIRNSDGEVLSVLTEKDDDFKIGNFEPDLIQVSAQGWVLRWSGRFEDELSPENLDLIQNNTFVQFTLPDAGAVSCRPSNDTAQPNSWTRNINRDVLKAGFLNMALSECRDELGATVDIPSLPFNLQGAYMLEK